ncbi:unnamed protein product [Caenorhabditis brenneri]
MQHVIGLGPRGHDTYTEHELINLPFTWIEDEAIWQFLWHRIHDTRTRQIEKCSIDTKSMRTWETFRSHTGSGRPLWKLKNYFQDQLAPSLPTAFLAEDTKLELYFGLGIPINMDFYNSFRKDAYMEVDNMGRINRFIGENGLHLAAHRYRSGTAMCEPMWEFLRQRIQCQRTGKLIHPTEMPCEFSLWKEYKDTHSVAIGVQALLKIYREEMVPQIHQTNFDLTTKAGLCFVLRIPVIPELLNELRKIAVVNINSLRRIVYYDQNGANSKWFYNECAATERNNFRRSAFTEQEEIAMFTFVYHKIQDHKTKRIRRDKSILQSRELWVEFDKTNRVHREPTTYMRRFKSIMLPVCYLANISTMMKMALHFALEIPVHEDLLKELRKTAIIELNREGCIIGYKERKKRVISGTSENSEVLIDLEEEPAPKIQKSDDEIIALDDVKPVSEINDTETELLLQHDNASENLGDLIPEDELLMIEDPPFTGSENPSALEPTEEIQREVEKIIDQMVSELDMGEQKEPEFLTVEASEVFKVESLKTDSQESFVTAPNSPLDVEDHVDAKPSAPKSSETLQTEAEAAKIISDAQELSPEPTENLKIALESSTLTEIAVDTLESSETPEFIENQESASESLKPLEAESQTLSQEGSVSSVNTVIHLGLLQSPELAPRDDDDEDSMSIIEIKEVIEEIIQTIEAQQ